MVIHISNHDAAESIHGKTRGLVESSSGARAIGPALGVTARQRGHHCGNAGRGTRHAHIAGGTRQRRRQIGHGTVALAAAAQLRKRQARPGTGKPDRARQRRRRAIGAKRASRTCRAQYRLPGCQRQGGARWTRCRAVAAGGAAAEASDVGTRSGRTLVCDAARTVGAKTPHRTCHATCRIRIEARPDTTRLARAGKAGGRSARAEAVSLRGGGCDGPGQHHQPEHNFGHGPTVHEDCAQG